MTGIDTNILARYFMRDDLPQSDVATRFFDSLSRENPGYLSLLTLAELWWVLSRSYKRNHAEIFALLHHLLDSKDLVIEKRDLVFQALNRAETYGADLADCLIAHSAAEASCKRTVTFDRNAARSAGMAMLS